MIYETNMEQSLILLKPDAVQRKLVGELISRFERKGLTIVAMKMLQMTSEMVKQHYRELVDKTFFPQIEKYITSEPLIAMILEGPQAINIIRQMVGPTDGAQAPAGTIRGDYAMSYRQNLIHASDSSESAQREMNLFFPDQL